VRVASETLGDPHFISQHPDHKFRKMTRARHGAKECTANAVSMRSDFQRSRRERGRICDYQPLEIDKFRTDERSGNRTDKRQLARTDTRSPDRTDIEDPIAPTSEERIAPTRCAIAPTPRRRDRTRTRTDT
jgi:hypothetical protein